MVELAEGVKLRGFGPFVVIHCWQVLQSPTNAARRCPLPSNERPSVSANGGREARGGTAIQL